MSHRYRVAFKETLCGKRHGFHKSNGFSREAQSSVRESMISSTGGYDPHLVSIPFTCSLAVQMCFVVVVVVLHKNNDSPLHYCFYFHINEFIAMATTFSSIILLH